MKSPTYPSMHAYVCFKPLQYVYSNSSQFWETNVKLILLNSVYSFDSQKAVVYISAAVLSMQLSIKRTLRCYEFTKEKFFKHAKYMYTSKALGFMVQKVYLIQYISMLPIISTDNVCTHFWCKLVQTVSVCNRT